MEIIKWLLLAAVTLFYLYKANKINKRRGFLSSVDLILPTFGYFIFLIVWLILFFVIL